MPRTSPQAARSQEDILEDVRSCITSVSNVACVVRLRSPVGDVAERALVDAAIARLHRLGAETRGLSREIRPAGVATL